MSDTLPATRVGSYLASGFMVPLVVWLLGHAWLSTPTQASLEPPLRTMLPVLVLIQAGAFAVFMPMLLRYAGPRAHGCGMMMLLLVPLPLYSVAWAAGAVEADAVVVAIGLLGGFALVTYMLYLAIVTFVPAGQFRSLLVRGGQFTLPLICWVTRNDWLQVVGL